ncbi:hypothetical protein TanjilG_28399 [Lupinus angustifolius]|uniref:GTP cyclohydrolase 1 n=1 Tax=Lupinus angustifolius TaxID=3871 RepID=A0A394DCJ0_LUPAN|nr:PREDICTED: GTP cyclohydrolase 1-like [Lupinus angustifolius]OIW21050.1 hypothetical protein TanjilG_28399 [Lupinus angustifolius]
MGCYDDGSFNAELENGVSSIISCEEEGNRAAIEDAVKVLLMGLGEDINREGIRKTPFRVAKALHEGTRGYRQNVKDIVQGALFPEAGLDDRVGHAGGAGGLVIVRDLDLFSYCESCLLPFQIKCHVGYVPSGQRVLGLSKLSRVFEVFAKRLQEPQRLADEVCSALHQEIKPAGVAIVLQCIHIHFPDVESVFLDSNHQPWFKMLVSSGTGVFENKNANEWADFYSLVNFRGINMEKIHVRGSSDLSWCPSKSSRCAEVSSEIGPTSLVMATAIASIIKSLGEDPSRDELVGTPSRFVRWLMKFRSSNFDTKLNGFLHGGIDLLNTNGEVNLYDKKLHSEMNLPFWSQCEHHLLPFHGVVHIGYLISDEYIRIGKSLFQSIVHFYGFKLQVQERLTRQIAETLSPLLGGDVIVVVEASHTCMISRGIEKIGSNTATIAVLGCFATDLDIKASFLESIPSPAASEEQ